MGSKFDKGIIPKRCAPLKVKNEEGLLWLGSANLLRMREIWLEERAELARRRKRELKKHKKSDKVFSYIHGLTERIDCREAYLKRLAANADNKPMVPPFRELNYYIDGRFCYALVDDNDGMEPGYIPVRVDCSVGLTMIAHPIFDLKKTIRVNVLSLEIFNAAELAYLKEHDEYRDFIAHFCLESEEEIEVWTELLMASKPDILEFLDYPECISPGHFE